MPLREADQRRYIWDALFPPAETKTTCGQTPSASFPVMTNAVAPGQELSVPDRLGLFRDFPISAVVVPSINRQCNVDCRATIVFDADWGLNECCERQ